MGSANFLFNVKVRASIVEKTLTTAILIEVYDGNKTTIGYTAFCIQYTGQD